MSKTPFMQETTKDMLLTFKSNMVNDDDMEDTIEFITPAKLTVKNNKYYIMFDEVADNGYTSSKSTLKIDNQKITLIRYGENSSQLIFEQGKKHTGNYQTPYGNFSLGVFSDSLTVDINETSVNLDISYGLYFEDEISHYNKLTININELKSGKPHHREN